MNTDFKLMSDYEPSGGSLNNITHEPAWYVHDGTYWTALGKDFAHGNGVVTSGGRQNVEQFAIRRWVSDYTGLINVSGHIAKLDPNATSNGVRGFIQVNGGPGLLDQYVSGSDTTGFSYSFDTYVTAGSTVDIWLDPWQANDHGDSTTFTTTIAAVPEAGTVVTFGVLGILGAMGLYRRRGPSGRR
jgi:hypothetical protein